MTLRRLFLLSLLLLLAAVAAHAQDAKQTLNDKLWEAARKGDAAAVKSLLDGGADVNAKFRYGTTALFKAAERGHTDVVKLLLERGADASVKDTFYGATAMTWALENKHTEVVRALLDKSGASVGEVLMAGVRSDNAEFVRMALAKGNIKPETLTTALVASTGDEKKAEIADLLRKAGAQPPPEVDAATLQSYVGTYRSEQGMVFAFTLKEGKLFGAPAGQTPLALMSVDKTTFKPTAFEGVTMKFNIEGGKPVGVALSQGANTTQLKRVESSQ